MGKFIKNIEMASPVTLKEEVEYESGRVNSITLAQEEHVGITLFAFDKGEGISTHAAPGDAFVYVLEGKACITVDGVENEVCGGQTLVMPMGIPHAVKAAERFKMLLTVVK